MFHWNLCGDGLFYLQCYESLNIALIVTYFWLIVVFDNVVLEGKGMKHWEKMEKGCIFGVLHFV